MLFIFNHSLSFINLLKVSKIQTPLDYIQDEFILIFRTNTKFLFKVHFLDHFLDSTALFHPLQSHYYFLTEISNLLIYEYHNY